MSEVRELVGAVERSRAALLASVAGLSEAQLAWRPQAAEWSILEVVEHLYLAELSGIAKIWAALEGVRAGRGWAEARPNDGKRIEEIVAATWKPKETAPPIATPHIGGPRAFWETATRSLTPALAALGDALEGVALRDVVFPHYLSGPLDGRQRLEFLRYHIDRHLGQIERTRASAGFPAK